ncbi:MAG: CCA tRNA nucleotidyltransferase [Rhizobiaceae bacterium]
MAAEPNLDWLHDEALQNLLALLNTGDEEARIAGGAVRNALLGQDVADIDIATTIEPAAVVALLEKAGYKVVPTGIEHGTVTAVADGKAFEITTLRQDIQTDGRHAQVAFGKDWLADAQRRDLTINALYMDANGTVTDPVGGLPDVENHVVRFVGKPETRIKEDYLRILRFFRFFAWYGQHRPDAAGLKACAKFKGGLASLSAERMWHELVKLLAAPDPTRAILWMRQTGVLSAILPESEKWGVDAFAGVVKASQINGWGSDPVLRLMSMLPPQEVKITGLTKRLKLPNKVRDRLLDWAATPEPDAQERRKEFAKTLYRGNATAITDRLKLAVCRDGKNQSRFHRLLDQATTYRRPQFPVSGKDLIIKGIPQGREISDRLSELEDEWVESGFTLKKQELLELK